MIDPATIGEASCDGATRSEATHRDAARGATSGAMRIAFHAPMKPPDHPVPSGDRRLARSLLAALHRTGHHAFVASRLRTWDGSGDVRRQQRLERAGSLLAERMLARWRRDPHSAPDLWFTYHLYHKAPDWLGPAVSRTLGIPYVVAEASIAGKQRDGRWARGFAAALDAVGSADAIVCVNPADLAGVRPHTGVPPDRLPPFIDVEHFLGEAAAARTEAAEWRRATGPRLATVAMMRGGAKLASYRLLAGVLTRLQALPWQLLVVGDGPARAEVEATFAPLPAGRVRFAGRQSDAAIGALLWASDLHVWPAIDEAFGMTLLEAQACGVACVAGRTPGVADLVIDGRTGLLAPAGNAEAFAAALEALLLDPPRRAEMGAAAAAHVRERHDVGAAAAALDAILDSACRRHAARVG